MTDELARACGEYRRTAALGGAVLLALAVGMLVALAGAWLDVQGLLVAGGLAMAGGAALAVVVVAMIGYTTLRRGGERPR